MPWLGKRWHCNSYSKLWHHSFLRWFKENWEMKKNSQNPLSTMLFHTLNVELCVESRSRRGSIQVSAKWFSSTIFRLMFIKHLNHTKIRQNLGIYVKVYLTHMKDQKTRSLASVGKPSQEPLFWGLLPLITPPISSFSIRIQISFWRM